MMRKLWTLLAGACAIALLAVASAPATANSIAPGGGANAIFPMGGLTLTIGGVVVNCPVQFQAIFNTRKTVLADGLINMGQINAAMPNPLICPPNNVAYAGFPWLIAALRLLLDGGIQVRILNVRKTVNNVCAYTGSYTMLITPAAGGISNIINVAGALAAPAPCPAMAVGGNGGTLNPGQRLI